jgi:nitrite reductase/ring-hydroxylating ferredoxin subunit
LKNDRFVKVANTSDIPVSKMKEVQVNGQNICLANIDGKYFAINNICSHEGGSLADGRLEGYDVDCLIRLGLDILRTINYKKDSVFFT